MNEIPSLQGIEKPEYIRSYELSRLSDVGQNTVYKCIERKAIEADAWVRASGHGLQPLFLSSRIPELLEEIERDKERYKSALQERRVKNFRRHHSDSNAKVSPLDSPLEFKRKDKNGTKS